MSVAPSVSQGSLTGTTFVKDREPWLTLGLLTQTGICWGAGLRIQRADIISRFSRGLAAAVWPNQTTGAVMVNTRIAAAAAALIIGFAATSAKAQLQPSTQAKPSGPVPDGKVAVINTGAFPAQILELKQKYDQVDTQFKDRYTRLQGIENQLKQLQTELETKQGVLKPEQLQEMQNNYQRIKTQGTRDLEDLRADVDKALDTATKPIRDKLGQFLQTFSQQRGIVMILNLQGLAQSGSVAYFSPATDVTNEFITEYNKANPGVRGDDNSACRDYSGASSNHHARKHYRTQARSNQTAAGSVDGYRTEGDVNEESSTRTNQPSGSRPGGLLATDFACFIGGCSAATSRSGQDRSHQHSSCSGKCS